MDYDSLLQDALAKVQGAEHHLSSMNIIIAGKSGVGKSTLINAAFRAEMAKTGTGKPVTSKISLIEKDGVPLRIYDTVGFELDDKKQKQSLKEIEKLIKATRKNDTAADDIHCMWYCVNASGHRFEDIEAKFINKVTSYDIPVIIVLTNSISVQFADELETEIAKRDTQYRDIVRVLVKQTDEKEAFGLEELISATFELLPDSIKDSFANVQRVSIKLKHNRALTALSTAVLATFGEGFSPLPVADAPVMMATQSALLAKITAIYGVDIDKHTLETTLSGVMVVFGAVATGKAIASSLLALTPGGVFVKGTISGGVAATLTTALGRAYMEVMERVLKGQIDLSEYSTDEMISILTDLVRKNLGKQN
jgi:predicted GTPase/uncharacterized protein (DUF697 family)